MRAIGSLNTTHEPGDTTQALTPCGKQLCYLFRLKCGYLCTVRYDWLAQFLFDSIEEVQEYATRWPWTYNHERPNMGLGGITPIQKLAMVAWSLLLKSVRKRRITHDLQFGEVTLNGFAFKHCDQGPGIGNCRRRYFKQVLI